jgi:hypothetical protein
MVEKRNEILNKVSKTDYGNLIFNFYLLFTIYLKKYIASNDLDEENQERCNRNRILEQFGDLFPFF